MQAESASEAITMKYIKQAQRYGENARKLGGEEISRLLMLKKCM